MTQIDSLSPTASNDTLLSQSNFEHEDGGQVDGIVISEQCAGHQQTGVGADGNFHPAESNVTFNTTKENEVSNRNADSKHPAPNTNTKALMPLTVPSGKPNGPSTPIVKKASIHNVLLINFIDNDCLDY